jgi:DNA invertase Pin-like site-specific DNA recombinase
MINVRRQADTLAACLEFLREGIANAKGEGKYKGRKTSIDASAIKSALACGEAMARVARRLGVARSSVY